ncbi:MAG: hypothetical protein AAFY88_18245, partial [Acidobacteriota bacterium]
TLRDTVASNADDDEAALQHAETLLVLAASAVHVPVDCGGRAASIISESPATLGECAAFARPRQRLGAPIFDAALDLLDRRLDGGRPAPSVLESAGRWLRRARRQPFRRGDKLRRLRLSWAEGRVLSLLGIARLAERRLERAQFLLGELGESHRFALVTLDLALLDKGRDDRSAASQRLASALNHLRGQETGDEVREMLRQARRASFDSLTVFRRRLGRQLSPPPPLAFRPAAPPPEVAWSTPSFGGVA